MKQKRTLTMFKFRGIGYNNDDFIYDKVSVVIRYRLNRQKKDSVWAMTMGASCLELPKYVLAQSVWKTFKSQLNITR